MSSQGVAAQIVRVRDARIRHCHCATKEATVELRQQNFPKLKSQNFGLSYRLKNHFILCTNKIVYDFGRESIKILRQPFCLFIEQIIIMGIS